MAMIDIDVQRGQNVARITGKHQPVAVHFEERGILWIQCFIDVDIDPVIRAETVVCAHQEVETGIPVNGRQQVEHY